jgi:hypothetical protein
MTERKWKDGVVHIDDMAFLTDEEGNLNAIQFDLGDKYIVITKDDLWYERLKEVYAEAGFENHWTIIFK